MSKFNNCVAVVTGAGSGIGRELSMQLANQGAKLALADIRVENLESTVSMLPKDCQVFMQAFDVSDEDAFSDFALKVQTHYSQVNLVINNAGAALASGPLWETSMDDFKWLMGVNFNGVLHGTMNFLPALKAASWGHIVNISSLFGLIAVPEQTAYNSSKFAVRGLTEALRQELEIDGSTVSCTSVHPGGVKTNIVAGSRISANSALNSEKERQRAISDFDKIAKTTAESAAKQILDAVINNKKRLLIGNDAKLVDKIQRIFPTRYDQAMRFIMRILNR